ncbi:MAG: hypothetical protein LQ350_005742 [Teloschistes chrysophthalmus]|nr:MAG: hypothetical protein LQ350_005742 [Niorma chrysophthalma]
MSINHTEVQEAQESMPKSYSAFLDVSRDCTMEDHSDPNNGFFPVPGVLLLLDYGILPVKDLRYRIERRLIPHDECRAKTEQRLEGDYWAETHSKAQMAILVPQNDRIPKEAFDRFCSLLMAHPQINTGTQQHAKLASTDARHDIALRRERVAKSAEELPMKPIRNTWETEHLEELQLKRWHHEWGPHFQQQMDLIAFRTLSKAQCCNIDILSKTYEDLDLPALLKSVAVEAGIQPLYATS